VLSQAISDSVILASDFCETGTWLEGAIDNKMTMTRTMKARNSCLGVVRRSLYPT